jgi:hypothetical protein
MAVRVVMHGAWQTVARPGPSATATATPNSPALRDAAIALDGDHVVSLGPRAEIEARFGPGERIDAVLLPALVNAHTHLELSHLRGRVPGGGGLVPWIRQFFRSAETHTWPRPTRDGSSRPGGRVSEVTGTLGALRTSRAPAWRGRSSTRCSGSRRRGSTPR